MIIFSLVISETGRFIIKASKNFGGLVANFNNGSENVVVLAICFYKVVTRLGKLNPILNHHR